MPYSDKQYLDPLHIVWRSGTSQDPYVDRAEYLKVVHHKVVLSEIPDKFTRVKITGMQEVNIDRITHVSLTPNQFSVNYSVGVIQFHESKEAQKVNIFYKGRGLIQYPSNRIYHQDELNDVVKSLDQIVQDSLNSVDYLRGQIDDKITDYQTIRDILIDKIDDINVATDTANEAIEEAEIATEKALDAYDTTRLVFKPYVQKYAEIAFKYPSPEVGWTTQVYDTGVRYRYDGIRWVAIDLFGGNIPIADENNNGLMSKETYNQVQELQNDFDSLEIEVDNLEKRTTERVIVFCYPYLQNGENSIIAKFPFAGKITSVSGLCSKFGTDVATEIIIEKSADMINWISIFDASKFMTFEKDSYFDSKGHVVIADTVNENDMFRVNVRTLSDEIEGVTIEIKIEV